ncbi:NirD/YgiW/YdeI family stress tolerance protein [Endozoicomonas sp. 4G]|uniref:NirD/YgiW/YdeI family stress tolerance protein n=1 Tax=Endozoicomonas sp. 4G TaxID=2872754 RepID=UPI002078EF1A|nr:NirD/YgiW/YdeI family stress tolerance protein [Endozoicomonas sp. 4G]
MKGLFFSGLCLLSLPAFSENYLPLPSPPVSAEAHDYKKQNIDQLTENGDDEELVRLSGQIIKKLKCSIYLFRDKTGEIQIQIKNDDIPKKGLLFRSPTIIKGEVMRDPNKPIMVEADKILYVF